MNEFDVRLAVKYGNTFAIKWLRKYRSRIVRQERVKRGEGRFWKRMVDFYSMHSGNIAAQDRGS